MGGILLLGEGHIVSDFDKVGKIGSVLSSSLDENEEPLLSSSDTKSCKHAHVCVFFIRLDDRLRWGEEEGDVDDDTMLDG